jgi:pyruvate,water dikinase
LPEAIRPLAELGGGDLALAGGKGANLGELVRGGFNVPPGFVITTAAGGDQLDAAITAAYEELGAPAVAVRSSATSEDGPDASFAGQHETFLHVQGEQDVLAAVRRCWESLDSERAVAYREQHGLGGEARIAVVVQRMAPHESAGVVFTVNPLTGNRDELLVNAARGAGEALVSGEVVPDQWVARRPDGAVLSFTPARRAAPAPAGFARAAQRGVLSSDGVRELAQIALRVEEHFGGTPQDIEWSYGEGEFFVLQARPITT